ncbi:tmem-135 [Pristionchus pacificus]|uniref:Tmem-135 protein n=1 Tax=Pristionchus pacificus TaxID=54126 RepID=A0A2A6B2M9_PRIPA|nr:tmem-135 [Pristionchus pacificus]|eukprot:PDM60121.1 tmem-135 protein [Pristionchus pacificus]
MAALSKLVAWAQGAPVLHSNCYETIHTWEPDCNTAWLVAVPEALRFSFKTYASFYLVTTLVGAKGNLKKIDWSKFTKDTLRSTVFLTCNLIFYLSFLCQIRRVVGFHSIPTLGYSNGILSSLCAILVEKKSRRPALALYLTNLASETLYRQLSNHGYLQTIPHGTFIPFAIGLALFKYLSTKGGLGKSMDGFLSSALQDKPDSGNSHIVNVGSVVQKNLPRAFKEMIERLKKDCGKTAACDHDDSCVYNGSKVFFHNASIGLALSSILSIVKNITKPGKIPAALISRDNLKMPLFFGLLPAIYHRARFRRLDAYSTEFPPLLSAHARNFETLSLQPLLAFYTHLVETGRARWIKHGDVLLYAISCGYVLGCATFEPHAIRKGYIHFLEGLTGNKIKQFNRWHFDFYGAESSKLYGRPDFNLNPKFVTMNPDMKPY